nr:hypothetical protein [Tanacetum cinerariifolium]
MPFYNLEFCDSNDSSLGIYIASRFSINSETIELLTFTPPMGDSPEGMLVVVYWFLYPHNPRHQVFNLLDMPVICCLHLRSKSSLWNIIFTARGTSPKILEVVIDEVCKWNNTTTSVVRLLPSDIQALSDFYTTPLSIHRGTSPKILEVVIDEVCKWNNTTTSVVRLLPSDIQALSDFYTTPLSIHRLVQQEVLGSMYQL